MKRREFITLLGGVAVALPLAARQQQPKLPTIGYLGPTTLAVSAQRLAAFQQRLRELGWIDGRNVAIEYRCVPELPINRRLDQINRPHKNGTAVRFKVPSIKFGTSGPLDAGSALFERLDTALLSGWKVGFEEFERQSSDAATKMLLPIVHVEVDNVGREMVVPRIDCSCERHGASFQRSLWLAELGGHAWRR